LQADLKNSEELRKNLTLAFKHFFLGFKYLFKAIGIFISAVIILLIPQKLYANLLPDAPDTQWDRGFETSALTTDDPCWEELGTASSIDGFEATYHSGSRACKFDNPTTAYSGRQILSATCTVTAGQTYQVGIWVYVEQTAGSITDTQVQLGIRWYDNSGTQIGEDLSTDLTLSAFTTWEKLTFSATAPSGATGGRFLVGAKETTDNGNDVIVDDGEFIQQESVPTEYNFKINGATITFNNGADLTVNGSILITETGTLTAVGTGTLIKLSKRWTKVGVFNAGNCEVEFYGVAVSTIYGDSTFYDFTCTQAGKQITFTAASTQTINGTLTLTGSSGNEIKLRSSSDGSRWYINNAGDTENVSYVDVKDSDATGNDITANYSVDSGNNDNAEASPHWIFAAPNQQVLQLLTRMQMNR